MSKSTSKRSPLKRFIKTLTIGSQKRFRNSMRILASSTDDAKLYKEDLHQHALHNHRLFFKPHIKDF